MSLTSSMLIVSADTVLDGAGGLHAGFAVVVSAGLVVELLPLGEALRRYPTALIPTGRR